MRRNCLEDNQLPGWEETKRRIEIGGDYLLEGDWDEIRYVIKRFNPYERGLMSMDVIKHYYDKIYIQELKENQRQKFERYKDPEYMAGLKQAQLDRIQKQTQQTYSYMES